MCKNATATAASLLSAIEPTFVNLLTLTGLSTTPDGTAAINAFKVAQEALATWKPGTSAQDAISAINAFSEVFAVLPIPGDAKDLEEVIAAGIDAVVGVLNANSPAPATVDATKEEAEALQTLHAHAVAADTEAKVAARIGFKPSVITKTKVMIGDYGAVAGQYKSVWNKTVERSDPKYASLKE